jgi:hypothetical protein
VEYRIFGPAGTPSEDFRRDLGDFLKLDEPQRNAIAEWFLASKDYDPFASPLPANIIASTLLPEQFQSGAQCLRNLLWAWQEYGLQLEDIERDLLLLGFASEALPVILSFLTRLATIKHRVWANHYARVKTFDGLPTMDELNFICEARAVFGGYPSGMDQVRDSYKQFLGMMPLVIMELVTSGNYGNKKRLAIQLTEKNFEGLQRAIGRAHEQLSILKERTAAATFDGNSLR